MSIADFFQNVLKSISDLNNKAGIALKNYAPTPTNLFQGGGNLIKATGSVVGQTASNLLAPLFPILAVLVFIYAFGSSR